MLSAERRPCSSLFSRAIEPVITYLRRRRQSAGVAGRAWRRCLRTRATVLEWAFTGVTGFTPPHARADRYWAEGAALGGRKARRGSGAGEGLIMEWRGAFRIPCVGGRSALLWNAGSRWSLRVGGAELGGGLRPEEAGGQTNVGRRRERWWSVGTVPAAYVERRVSVERREMDSARSGDRAYSRWVVGRSVQKELDMSGIEPDPSRRRSGC